MIKLMKAKQIANKMNYTKTMTDKSSPVQVRSKRADSELA